MSYSKEVPYVLKTNQTHVNTLYKKNESYRTNTLHIFKRINTFEYFI